VIGALGTLRDWQHSMSQRLRLVGYFLGEFPPGKKGRVLEAHASQEIFVLPQAPIALFTLCKRTPTLAGRTLRGIQAAPDRVGDGPLVVRFIQRRFNDNFARHPKRTSAVSLNNSAKLCPTSKALVDFVGINYYSRLRVGFELRSPRTLFSDLSSAA